MQFIGSFSASNYFVTVQLIVLKWATTAIVLYFYLYFLSSSFTFTTLFLTFSGVSKHACSCMYDKITLFFSLTVLACASSIFCIQAGQLIQSYWMFQYYCSFRTLSKLKEENFSIFGLVSETKSQDDLIDSVRTGYTKIGIPLPPKSSQQVWRVRSKGETSITSGLSSSAFFLFLRHSARPSSEMGQSTKFMEYLTSAVHSGIFLRYLQVLGMLYLVTMTFVALLISDSAWRMKIRSQSGGCSSCMPAVCFINLIEEELKYRPDLIWLFLIIGSKMERKQQGVHVGMAIWFELML